MIKRLVFVFVMLSVLFIGALNCSAVTLDGKINGDEWSQSIVLPFEHPDGFNNDVNFAVIRLLPDYEKYQMNICIVMIVNNLSDYHNSSVILSFDGEREIRLNGDLTSEYDSSFYSADFSALSDSGSYQITYEATIGLKDGFGDVDTLWVSLCDCNGERSNVFDFDLDFENSSEPTDVTEPEKEKTTKKPSASKNKTKGKGNSGKTDSFTFKKVVTEENVSATDDNRSEETTGQSETVNLTKKPVSNSEIKKKVFTATAVICVALITTCAVYNGIKKSKNAEKDKG